LEEYEFTRRRCEDREDLDADELCDGREQATEFLLNVINATIYSSGEDYDSALQQFFPQLQSLGVLIGARSVDEVSAFLRRNCPRL